VRAELADHALTKPLPLLAVAERLEGGTVARSEHDVPEVVSPLEFVVLAGAGLDRCVCDTAACSGALQIGRHVPMALAIEYMADADTAVEGRWDGIVGSRSLSHARSQTVSLTTNQFKNGNHIEVDGVIFKIIEFQHVKPGKGGAFVRTKLRRVSDGAVIDRTFRAGERFRSVRTESRKMQFLYADGTEAHFMDSSSYEQLAVPEATVAHALRFTRASDEVDLLFIDGEPGEIQLPSAVDLEVSDTEPGLRGDTASGGGTKPATLETGAQVHVPLFVNIGDRVRVDTRTGDYVSRA
jgi:elongation factor P